MSRQRTRDVRIDWHEGGTQVLLGLDGERVKVAVAFSTDVARSELEEILVERDREIDHYFSVLADRLERSS